MSQTTTELKNEARKSLDLMRTLRDEVRVKIHLAGMDAKQEWSSLEPHLADLERSAKELTAATHAAVSDAVKRLAKLAASLS